MQNQKSNFAQIFLLEFTKQLIENSKSKGIIEIEQREKIKESEEITHLENLEKTPKKIHTKIKKVIPKIEKPIEQKIIPIPQKIIPKPIVQRKPEPLQKIIPNKQPIAPQAYPKTFSQKMFTKGRKLIIPEQRLPSRFQNIRPAPTKREIDLGKLNPIIADPMAHSIECDGPNIPMRVVTKTGQKRNTKIVLTKEEIDKIINTFSTATRIPALEGIYKVAIGTLILLAVISEVVGTKFVIRKISQRPQGGASTSPRPASRQPQSGFQRPMNQQRFPPRGIPKQSMPPRQMIRR